MSQEKKQVPVEGHWHRSCDGQLRWIEPQVVDPERAAEELLEYMAGTDDDPDEPEEDQS